MSDPVTYVPYLHPADEECDLCACSACGAYTWVKRVAKPLDSPAPMVSQLLHRSVVLRLTEERDAAQREVQGLQAALEKARALNAGRYKILHEAVRHVGGDGSEQSLPYEVERLVHQVERLAQERDAAQERLMLAHRALQAGDLVVRGLAGETVAEKIEALVALLRTACAERDQARALVAADTAKMLELMNR